MALCRDVSNQSISSRNQFLSQTSFFSTSKNFLGPIPLSIDLWKTNTEKWLTCNAQRRVASVVVWCPWSFLDSTLCVDVVAIGAGFQPLWRVAYQGCSCLYSESRVGVGAIQVRRSMSVSQHRVIRCSKVCPCLIQNLDYRHQVTSIHVLWHIHFTGNLERHQDDKHCDTWLLFASVMSLHPEAPFPSIVQTHTNYPPLVTR